MPVFNDPRKLRQHLEDAAAAQLRLTVVQAQADLGSAAVSPIDTGRFRSSWFASKGAASDQVAPEGANAPATDAQALRLTHRDEVHLANSLPYAEALALGENLPPSWGGTNRVVSKPATWFKDFRDSRLPKIAEAAARHTKKTYDL
jgi:hypothetical protein